MRWLCLGVLVLLALPLGAEVPGPSAPAFAAVLGRWLAGEDAEALGAAATLGPAVSLLPTADDSAAPRFANDLLRQVPAPARAAGLVPRLDACVAVLAEGR